MTISAIATSTSPRPPQTMKGLHAPRPAVTGAPFTPNAQKQAAAIATGRQPHRGQVFNIVV